MQILETHGTVFGHVQSRRAEQRDDIGELHMAVALMKAPQNTVLLLPSPKIHHEYAAARLKHPAHLARTRFAKFARQMMKHQRTQDDIELPVRKRKRFDNVVFLFDVEPGVPGFRFGPGYHFRRCVDPINLARWSDRRLAASASVPVPQPTSRTEPNIMAQASKS